jgi:hypothetical protein
MPEPPDGIDLSRHRDFEGRRLGQILRHGFLALLLALVVAGLLNLFGQASTTSSVEGAAATLTLTAPNRVRGGLLYQATFRIHARQAIGAPTLVLARGWLEQTTVNTVEPEPVATTSDEGHVKLRFAPMPPGRTLTVYVDLQVNPTNLGSHDGDVALFDADRPLVAIDRTQLDLP